MERLLRRLPLRERHSTRTSEIFNSRHTSLLAKSRRVIPSSPSSNSRLCRRPTPRYHGFTWGRRLSMKRHGMGGTTAPISFAGSELSEVRHLCALFNSAEEEYHVLLPFIKDGFARGDRAVHVVGPDQQDEHLKQLAGIGIDTAMAEESGQLDLRTNVETYLHDGRFDQDRILEVFEEVASSPKGGFRLDRIVCHIEWAAGDQSHIHDLVEFESRVNEVWRRHDDAVICVCDLAKFGGDTVVDMIRTHPLIIIGGTLQRNPFFVPPESFPPELRERRTRQISSPLSAL